MTQNILPPMPPTINISGDATAPIAPISNAVLTIPPMPPIIEISSNNMWAPLAPISNAVLTIPPMPETSNVSANTIAPVFKLKVSRKKLKPNVTN